MPYTMAQNQLGVIDIGSNSVRMVIYDMDHHPPVKNFNEKVICALGRDLGVTGRLNDEATESAFKALLAYKLLSEVYKVKDLEVVGTAALRDATDGPAFIQKVRDEIGLSIRIISGDEEATYAAHGVLMFDRNADGVVADFGGGSLELARIHSNQVHDTISLPLGAYRVLSMGEEAPQRVSSILSPLGSRFGHLKALYAIGGSWRVLASAYMKHTGRKSDLQGYTIPRDEMIQFCNEISRMDADTVAKTYRMESHQAKLAFVASRTLALVLHELQPESFVVSTAGVRDGVAHEFLLSHPKTK